MWGFVLTDLKGTPLAELTDITSRRTTLSLNRISSGMFQCRTDNANAAYVRQGDQVHVKAYRNGILLGQGPLLPGYQKQVQANSRTIQVSWAGIGWRLGRRIIEASKAASGVTYGDPSNPASYQDRGAMAVSIINGLNGATPPAGVPQSSMDTGIRIGSTPLTSSTAVGPWFYKNALQAISELSATLDGFDWELAPVEPVVDATGVQFATFNCAAAIGSYRPDVVFEYGDGKFNVASFTESTDFSGGLNRGYSLPQGFPDNATQTPLSSYDATCMGNAVVYEDTVSSDLVTDDMRSRLLTESVKVRKLPRQIITFQPTVQQAPGVVPSYGTDYIVGDTVRFRAVEYGVETVNAIFRVYEVNFEIDDNGAEVAIPTLISADAGGNAPQFSS